MGAQLCKCAASVLFEASLSSESELKEALRGKSATAPASRAMHWT